MPSELTMQRQHCISTCCRLQDVMLSYQPPVLRET